MIDVSYASRPPSLESRTAITGIFSAAAATFETGGQFPHRERWCLHRPGGYPYYIWTENIM